METKTYDGIRIPGLPGRYMLPPIPGVYISGTEPVEADAKVWVNPYGNKMGNGRYSYASMYGVVSAVLNDAYINTAKKYSTIANALAGSNETADGKVLAYTNGGMLNIVLTEDMTSAEITTVEKDCTIHLNGHELSFAVGKHFLLKSGKMTINGSVQGSKIAKTNISGGTEFLVRTEGVAGTELNLVGGVYSITGTATTGIVPICMKDYTYAKLTLCGCDVVVNGTAGSVISGLQVADDTIIENCNLDVDGSGCASTSINSRNAKHEYTLTVRDSTFATKGNTKSVLGITLAARNGVMNNCTFLTVANSDGVEAKCITAANTCNHLTINNCRAKANGDGTADVYAVYRSSESTEVTINNGYYCGANKALNLLGTVHINGETVDGSAYTDKEISLGTESATDTAILCVKDEDGKWVAVC